MKTYRKFTLLGSSFALFWGIASLTKADISLTGVGTFGSENFNSLAASGTANSWVNNSTIPNWYASTNIYRASAGTDTTGGLYSFGSNSADRALGALSSGTASPIFGVVMVNNSGGDINLADIQLSFVGEQWRQTVNAQALLASYQISSTPFTDVNSGSWTTNSALHFTAPQTGTAGPLDGNLPANQTSFSLVPVAASGVLADGEYLMVRWVKTGTTSPGLGIDNFSVTVVPEPGTVVMLGIGLGALAMLRRAKRA